MADHRISYTVGKLLIHSSNCDFECPRGEAHLNMAKGLVVVRTTDPLVSASTKMPMVGMSSMSNSPLPPHHSLLLQPLSFSQLSTLSPQSASLLLFLQTLGLQRIASNHGADSVFDLSNHLGTSASGTRGTGVAGVVCGSSRGVAETMLGCARWGDDIRAYAVSTDASGSVRVTGCSYADWRWDS